MRYLLLVVSLLILFGGVNDTWTSWQNPQPVAMTLREFAQAEPKPVYVRLSDARPNLVDAVIVGRRDAEAEGGGQQIKSVTRLYIPIRPEGAAKDEKVSLLLDTRGKGLLATANEFNRLSSVDQLLYFAEHSDDLVVNGPVSGRVARSSTMSADRREQLRKLKTDLAEEFFVLEHNSLPSLRRGITALVAGVLLLLLSLTLISRRRARALRAKELSAATGNDAAS
jgi:hypothetical protein